jgi:prohibitin 2
MPRAIIATVLASLVFLILMAQSCTVIDAGSVGVHRTLGEVHPEPLKPGLHFVKPLFIDSVTELDTRLKSFEVNASAASKDMQVVTTVISVQHSLNPDLASKSYAAIGDLEKFDASIVAPAVLESLKAVTAKYTAEELIVKRDIVAQQIGEAIQKFIDHTLQNRGIGGALDVANVAIKNFDFSKEFNESIESKVRAQQEALRAENEKTKRMTDADAKAYEVTTAADAKAAEIDKQSVAQAAAIEREAKALSQNPLLIQLRAIEKWNGNVPQMMAGDTVPFVDLRTRPQ